MKKKCLDVIPTWHADGCPMAPAADSLTSSFHFYRLSLLSPLSPSFVLIVLPASLNNHQSGLESRGTAPRGSRKVTTR